MNLPEIDPNADKGEKNGVCNRGACNCGPATHYNHSTLQWYCSGCAYDIQSFENSMEDPFCIFEEFYIPKNADEDIASGNYYDR